MVTNSIALALFFAIIGAATSGPLSFETFKSQFGKHYKSDVHEALGKVWFERNSQTIQAHNERHAKGLETYSMKINQFTDQDPKEFHRVRHGAIKDPSLPSFGGHFSSHGHQKNYSHHHKTTPVSSRSVRQTPPDSFDWNAQGMVSSVKDQGQCGCCWAFSAMAAIESAVLMVGQTEVDLSEEQLVDCFQQSCQGQDQRNAWNWLQNNGGADSLSSYPYTAGDGNAGQCNTNAQVVQQVTGYNQLNMPTDDDTLKNYLMQNGPLAIDVDASGWSQNYGAGILTCSNPGLDHAILLTGWDKDQNGTPYWIIKNSWGTGWGEQGFGWVQMGNGVDCGVNQWLAAYPTIS